MRKVLPSRCTATSRDRFVAMMPELTTVTTSNTVPRSSATTCCENEGVVMSEAQALVPSQRPISSSRYFGARKPSIRAFIAAKATANALSFSEWDPSTAAGSAMPQCTRSGCPGQIGQASPAALSQTVTMRSMSGAGKPENSSQVFERKPSAGLALGAENLQPARTARYCRCTGTARCEWVGSLQASPTSWGFFADMKGMQNSRFPPQQF